MTQIDCIVVTPEKTALEKKVDFVTLTLSDGEMGIAPNHSPMIGRLGFGEMRLVSGGQTERYYVDGGFVQVNNNVVSVLTERAVPATQLDRNHIRTSLDEAMKRPIDTDERLEIRERLVRQAQAQLSVVRRSGP